MENLIMNDEQWVNERLRALDPENDWRPNAGAAFAGLQRRDRRRRGWQRGWFWSTAMASLCAFVMLGLPAPAKCALVRVGCRGPLSMPVLLAPAVTANAEVNYKESGSLSAPVVSEIYTDYECPYCANFYLTVYPKFYAEFVKTGKVRVIHRDFPLPQHQYSRLAVRYANAAGELGHYGEVVNQLFATQAEWGANGNVDQAVAHVLPTDIMSKVRSLVESDPALDATIAADMAMVAHDQINQTPTIVFVYKGTRHKVVGPPSFELLRKYLEEILAQ
jgi:protein-disulfide isomerase